MLRSILQDGMGVSEAIWIDAERLYDEATASRRAAVRSPSGRKRGSQRIVRYCAVRAQPDRPYGSIDRIELERFASGRVDATLTRVEPETRRGAQWECVGYMSPAALHLTFWPLFTADERLPKSDSTGQFAVQREVSLKKPWAGFFTKLKRRSDNTQALEQGTLTFTSAEDPNLVDAASTVALLDYDNTLAAGWIIRPWMSYLARAEVGATATAEGELDDLFTEFSRTSGFDHDRLAREASAIYASALCGVQVSALEILADEFAADYLASAEHIFPSTRHLIEGLRSRGLRPILLTGAPEAPMMRIAEDLKIQTVHAMTLKHGDGTYTGQVADGRALSTVKEAYCEGLVSDGECEVVVAIGDSESDRTTWSRARVSIRVGGDPRASDLTISGIDLRAPLSREFWDHIPEAAWRTLISGGDPPTQ